MIWWLNLFNVSLKHPRVRYAACNCIGQMATDFAPTFQKKFHTKVIPGLLMILDDEANPRVQAHGGAALVNFAEDSPKNILLTYLDSILNKLLDVLIKKVHEVILILFLMKFVSAKLKLWLFKFKVGQPQAKTGARTDCDHNRCCGGHMRGQIRTLLGKVRVWDPPTNKNVFFNSSKISFYQIHANT